jgi:MGT family glycosyltransferase
MPKAIFFSVPGYGHILPSLPLVRALVSRGHDIHCYTTPAFNALVAETGANVHLYNRIQDDYFSARGLHSGVPGKVAVALLTTTGEVLPELIEHAADADYVIYDCLCAWGYHAAHAVKRPSIVSYPLMPLSIRSLGDLRILRAFLPTIIKAQADYRRASRIAKELGARYDVTPLDPSTFLNAPGDLEICYSSAEFVPHAEALPRTMRFVGWWMPEERPEKLYRREDRPLIYLSLGTVNNENRSFFQVCNRCF